MVTFDQVVLGLIKLPECQMRLGSKEHKSFVLLVGVKHVSARTQTFLVTTLLQHCREILGVVVLKGIPRYTISSLDYISCFLGCH